MDKIVAPDCPECHGVGHVPFDEDMDAHDQIIHRRHCGTCLKRWDDANPLPKQPTTAELQQAIADVRAHIERLVRIHHVHQSRAFDSALADKAYEHAARANELTEVLAMLDRVQEGGGK